jgi:hypothetical protein
MHARSASVILLCLGLATIAVLIGFAFLRVMTRMNMTGSSETVHGLARSAALSGLAHASEQILIDYNNDSLYGSLPLACTAGGIPTMGVPTHLDGPYRAPFVEAGTPAITYPNQVQSTENTTLSQVFDDVPEENHLLLPMIDEMYETYVGTGGWHAQFGAMIYDGRGRYVEPGYLNVTRPNPAANPQPVVPTFFSDPNAAPTDRTDALFLDKDFHRLVPQPGETTQQMRLRARYRIRYAIGVEDLQGHLLTNPRAAMDFDWTHASNDYRAIPGWLNAAGYVWSNMVAGWMPCPSATLRMQNVFLGRGHADNADRRWTADAQFGLPAAFPNMFRAQGVWTGAGPTNGNTYPASFDQWWGSFTFDGSHCVGAYYNGIASDGEFMGGRLFRFYSSDSRIQPIAASAAGGQVLTPTFFQNQSANPDSFPYLHALVGPQMSWFNQFYAMAGVSNGYDGVSGGGAAWPLAWNSQRSPYLTIPTPFGRGMENPAVTPAVPAWYQGPVNSPWLVNVLTAAPQTVSQMILAYLPPELKNLHYNVEEWYHKTGEGTNTDPVTHAISYYDIFSPTYYQLNTNGGNGWNVGFRGLDILNDQMGSGFADFPAPSSIDAGTTIKPDYYQSDPEPAAVPQRYPGPLSRGDSTVTDQGSNDLGQYIDADSRGIGYCSHTGQPLMYIGGGDITYTVASNYPGAPGWTRPNVDLVIRRIDTSKYTLKYSYFWDMAYAMTQAIAFARANWVQYPNYVFDPTTGFVPSTLRDFRKYSTLQQLDRLFLRQMGENFDSPGTPCPDNPIVFTSSTDNNRLMGTSLISYQQSYSVSPTPAANTIASLVAKDLISTTSGVSSAERAKVMERMLNDFRLSFFGCSPAYSATFRPLDFIGDGHVQCSCYDINPNATANEVKYMTARWQPADATGQGPAPAPLGASTTSLNPDFGSNPWFCVSGCFFIGKSHYYRVLTRGEVFDNLLGKPVASQTLESVLAVDPEAPLVPAANRIAVGTQTLFQRWHYNNTTAELPLHLR